VLLAAVVPIACNLAIIYLDISGFLRHAYVDKEGTPYALAVADLQSILNFSYLFSPMILGFWAAFAWRGWHFKDYILLSFIVGALALAFQLSFEPFIRREVEDLKISEFFKGLYLRYVVLAYFVTPALMFNAGGLFGDWWQTRDNPSAYGESRIARRIVSWLPGVEENSRVVANIQLLGPLAAALLGLLSAFIGLIAAAI